MVDEITIVRELRPEVAPPTEAATIRARDELQQELDGRKPRGFLNRRFRSSPRWWLVPSVAVLVLGTAGLGVAGELAGWWTDADPPVRLEDVRERLDPGDAARRGAAEPDLSRARTVARAPGAALVAAPAGVSGYCIVPVPDRGEPSFVCLYGDASGADTLLSWTSPERDRSWYLLGRVHDPDASKISLFDTVTYPFRAGGPQRLPGTPLVVDIGPGGFFLVRVPTELQSALDLAYGEVSTLDANGRTISRGCRFVGAPASSLPPDGIASAGDPLATSVARAGGYPCPETGSAADEASMRLIPPRDGDLGHVVGRDAVTGRTVRLSEFAGRPLFVAVVDPSVPTALRLLSELDRFARRHPDAGAVAMFHRRDADEDARRAAQHVGLGFPLLLQQGLRGGPTALLRDARGGFDPHVVVLDAEGRIAAELATPSRRGAHFALVSQQTLEQALAAARSG
jgi:hypothetical protein